MNILEKYSHIKFKKHWAITKEIAFQLGQCDNLIKTISALPLQPEYKKQLLTVSLVKGALATTAIEGNTLTEQDIENIQKGKHLPPSKEYQEIEVKNIIDTFNDIIKDVVVHNKSSLISLKLLRQFHKAIGKNLGKHFEAIPGKFRTDNRIVGTYRTPDHGDVKTLVEMFCDWLKEDFKFERGHEIFNSIIKAIVTHIYIEFIHPFGDGNGRTGRLAEFYILLRSGAPIITSHILSTFYNETRPEYYRQFENAKKKKDLTEFIAYAVQGYRDGLIQTFEVIRDSLLNISWQKFIYDRFADQKYANKNVFKRRRNLMLQLNTEKEFTLNEIILLTPQIAKDYASLSLRTIDRDLKELERLELLTKNQDKYKANIKVLAHLIPK